MQDSILQSSDYKNVALPTIQCTLDRKRNFFHNPFCLPTFMMAWSLWEKWRKVTLSYTAFCGKFLKYLSLVSLLQNWWNVTPKNRDNFTVYEGYWCPATQFWITVKWQGWHATLKQHHTRRRSSGHWKKNFSKILW